MWGRLKERWQGIARNFGEDFRGLYLWALFVVPLGGAFLALEWFSPDPGAFSAVAFYMASIIAMFTFPVFAAVKHQWRQARAMDKVRAAFAQGLEALNSGQTKRAERYLLTIQRWEVHWRFGNSWIYRTAYSAVVIAITSGFGVLHYMFYYTMHHPNGLMRKRAVSLVDAVSELSDKPVLLTILVVMGSAYGVTALNALRHLNESSWRDYYSHRFEAILKAGRSVGTARPLHDFADVTPRELFGLNDVFTKAQLRRAWLRLAKELHPDAFAMADAQTRAAKEAALKRVNAMRDHLEPLARG